VKPISIYIDADACPLKQEIYRVAERHARKGTALKVFVVSNGRPVCFACASQNLSQFH